MTETTVEDPFSDIETPKRPRGRPKGSTNANSNPNPNQEAEAKSGLHSLFEFISSLAHSDASFEESEFTPLARAITRLAKVHPQLNVIMTVLGFVTIPAHSLRFVQRIMANRVKREDHREGQHDVVIPTPDETMGHNGDVTAPSPHIVSLGSNKIG